MGVALFRHLSDAQVFNHTESCPQVADEFRNEASGSVESFAWRVVQAVVDGQSQKAVGRGTGSEPTELADFRGSTESAGPPLTAETDQNGSVATYHAGEKGFGG